MDAIWLPRGGSDGPELGDDLTGDGYVDNALECFTNVAAETGALQTHDADLIGAGSLASSFEIQTDDLENGSAAGVSYFGADGDAAVAVGGRFRDGSFESNRTRSTRHTGLAHARLPIFADADPVVATIVGLEIELVPDGHGGYLATIRGGIPAADVIDDMIPGISQMVFAEPGKYLGLARATDINNDGQITDQDLGSSSLIAALLEADATLLGGKRVFSLGFEAHLLPCPSGNCAEGHAVDHCYDRVADGDETDVDCGGSCIACPGGSACSRGDDCQTGVCASGQCTAPACSDGLRDGFESDLDCGGTCGPCQAGQACIVAGDCASMNCTGSWYATGACAP